MTYRDERDGASARVTQLEEELEQAREEIARLRGGSVKSNPWLGGPAHIQIERVVDGELPESAYEELVERLRAHVGQMGRSEKIGGTFAWQTEPDMRGRGRNFNVRFTVRDGKTRIRIEERLGQIAGGLFGGIVGGAGGAGAINLLVWTGITGNPLLAAGAIGWLGLVYGIVRTSFGAFARGRARKLEALAAELEDAAKAAMPRVRVETEEDEELEVEARLEPAKKKGVADAEH